MSVVYSRTLQRPFLNVSWPTWWTTPPLSGWAGSHTNWGLGLRPPCPSCANGFVLVLSSCRWPKWFEWMKFCVAVPVLRSVYHSGHSRWSTRNKNSSVDYSASPIAVWKLSVRSKRFLSTIITTSKKYNITYCVPKGGFATSVPPRRLKVHNIV